MKNQMATVSDAALAWHCSASRARDIINQLERNGDLTVLRTVSGIRLIAVSDV